MPAEKIPARDIIIQVEESTADTWAQINQLTSATFNPSENEETADTTTFDSQGEYEQLIMQRGAVMEMEGYLRKDSATGAMDAGQARVEALAKLKGVGSLGRLRFRHPMDGEWQIWNATFTVGEQGGGTNDMTSWAATITKSGPTETATVEVQGG